MANNTFKEIADVLLRAENILIYPHINADGDAAGSAAALCHGLRSLGFLWDSGRTRYAEHG